MDIKVAREYYYRRETCRREEREIKRLQCLKQVRHMVAHHAPRYPQVRCVYLFGSLLQAGRFSPNSDIDIAVGCDSLEAESAFWQALERSLQRDVDLRPLTGPIIEILTTGGEQIYERKDIGSIK